MSNKRITGVILITLGVASLIVYASIDPSPTKTWVAAAGLFLALTSCLALTNHSPAKFTARNSTPLAEEHSETNATQAYRRGYYDGARNLPHTSTNKNRNHTEYLIGYEAGKTGAPQLVKYTN